MYRPKHTDEKSQVKTGVVNQIYYAPVPFSEAPLNGTILYLELLGAPVINLFISKRCASVYISSTFHRRVRLLTFVHYSLQEIKLSVLSIGHSATKSLII